MSNKAFYSTNRARTLQVASVIIAGVLLIAATWRGVFDTTDNPRSWDNTQIAEFIYAVVNQNINQWQPGDTVTICRSGSTTCILVVYANIMSGYSWAKARNVDSRDKPIDASLWERFIKWLLLGGGTTISELAMVNFLWEEDYLPVGTVTVGPLMPVGQSNTSLSCSTCHN